MQFNFINILYIPTTNMYTDCCIKFMKVKRPHDERDTCADLCPFRVPRGPSLAINAMCSPSHPHRHHHLKHIYVIIHQVFTNTKHTQNVGKHVKNLVRHLRFRLIRLSIPLNRVLKRRYYIKKTCMPLTRYTHILLYEKTALAREISLHARFKNKTATDHSYREKRKKEIVQDLRKLFSAPSS